MPETHLTTKRLEIASSSAATPAPIAPDRLEELDLLASVIDGDRIAAERLVDRYNDLIEMSVRRVFRRAGRSAGH